MYNRHPRQQHWTVPSKKCGKCCIPGTAKIGANMQQSNLAQGIVCSKEDKYIVSQGNV